MRTEGTPEEDSLAEKVQRAPLHPLDQFRAFLALREKGQSEEEIAATFFVSVADVKQRLRLASVSPKLLDVFAEGGMPLDQLMAFTVSPDHERQEQVWEAIQRSYNKEPYRICDSACKFCTPNHETLTMLVTVMVRSARC
jgi:ParB family transcriptional regulator, chromosome partitioning protein